MNFNYFFPIGIESIFGGSFVRPVNKGDVNNPGLLTIDLATGASAIKFAGINIYAVAHETEGLVVGMAGDDHGLYAFTANLEDNTFSKLGYVKKDGFPNFYWSNSAYEYDRDNNILYMMGGKGQSAGIIALDFNESLSKAKVGFMQTDDNYVVSLDHGSPICFTYDPSWKIGLHMGASASDGDNLYWAGTSLRTGNAGIAIFSHDSAQYELRKFVEITPGFEVGGLSYDQDDQIFYATVFRPRGVELVAIDFSGDVFKLGTTVRNDMEGTRSDDFFMSLGGNDLLDGAAGDDKLDGGVGNDVVSGGRGEDTFIFSTDGDKDTITDFDDTGPNQDIIDLSGADSIRNFKDLERNHLSERNGNAVIDAGNGDILILKGADADKLSAEDFIF